MEFFTPLTWSRMLVVNQKKKVREAKIEIYNYRRFSVIALEG
jgi:hypothetical protein